MTSSPKHHRSPRPASARSVALVALVLLVLSLLAAAAAGAVALRGGRTGLELRGLQRAAVVASASSAIASLPRERGGRCERSAMLPGQGNGCRAAGGLVRLQLPHGRSITTHGFDPRPVAGEAPSGARSSGRLLPPYGSQADGICGQSTRGRVFLLAHLLPSDYRSSINPVRRSSTRVADVRDQLRQAAWDASHHVDLRARALTTNAQRRRMRFQCDPDGRPTVARVVLPRTEAVYADDRGVVIDGTRMSGFVLMIHDLTALGVRPEYAVPYGGATKMVAQRKVIGYYDGQFKPFVGGQGETIPLDQGGLAGTPWGGRTSRGIHNNQPYAMTAIQYATAYDAFGGPDPVGVPDPPSFTTILHESTHTMGAVQDGAPQSSGAGHCNDGLDVMCYADHPGSAYSEGACPDVDGIRTPQDEVYDCQSNTYFDPAPSGWLASHWNLGEPMNEFFARETVDTPAPGVPPGFAAAAGGTRVRLRYGALPAESGLQYEAWQRLAGGTWTRVGSFTGTTLYIAGLKPSRDYEFAVAGADRFGNQGVAALALARTGLDTTAPSRVARPGPYARQRHSLRLQWGRSTDNVAVRGYHVDQLVGSSWRLVRTVAGPGGNPTLSPWITGLAARTTQHFRVRAFDARGNYSAGVSVAVATT